MRIIKILRLCLHIILGIILTLILAGVLRQSSKTTLFAKTKKWWLKRVCDLLSIQIDVHGKPANKTVLYAANHISWLDIPVLASVVNPVFLSKAEVRSWPLIGWLAYKGGTLFIHRGDRDSALHVNNTMMQTLQEGKQQTNPAIPGSRYSILFFPEGTTSDGTGLLRFRPRLFSAAVDADVPVQPVLLYYPDKQNNINPVVPFIGKQTVLESLWKILAQKSIRAEVYFLEPIPSTGKSNKQLAQECQTALHEKHQMISQNAS